MSLSFSASLASPADAFQSKPIALSACAQRRGHALLQNKQLKAWTEELFALEKEEEEERVERRRCKRDADRAVVSFEISNSFFLFFFLFFILLRTCAGGQQQLRG